MRKKRISVEQLPYIRLTIAEHVLARFGSLDILKKACKERTNLWRELEANGFFQAEIAEIFETTRQNIHAQIK